MNRKRLGIVSSYNEECGNASYTHVLKEEFSNHYEVEVIPVSPRALSGRNAQLKLKAVCDRIAACDLVNIQFESGLYGTSPKAVARHVIAMIQASRRLVFTMHRIHIPSESRMVLLSLGYQLITGSSVAGSLRGARAQLLVDRMAHRITNALRAKHRADPSSVTVMVHTAREREALQYHFDIDFCVDHPITFLTRAQIADHVTRRDELRDIVLREHGLDADARYIGIFGFLSENKGHHVAVEAMRFLPPEYRLLIFGGQHPMSIDNYDFGKMLAQPKLFSRNKSVYIASLIDLAQEVIEEDKEDPDTNDVSRHRVQFLGSLDDPSFIRAITAMDFVVLPYLESGQGGSGNASLVLELHGQAIMARNHAFMELARYYPDCFAQVDIGNPLQLAKAIQSWSEDRRPAQRAAIARYNIENNVLLHCEAFEHGADAAKRMLKNITVTPMQVDDTMERRLQAA